MCGLTRVTQRLGAASAKLTKVNVADACPSQGEMQSNAPWMALFADPVKSEPDVWMLGTGLAAQLACPACPLHPGTHTPWINAKLISRSTGDVFARVAVRARALPISTAARHPAPHTTLPCCMRCGILACGSWGVLARESQLFSLPSQPLPPPCLALGR